ncbi:MAG TPA: cytochrome c biogenesis protein ResB [Prosthecobacter sp.]
MSDQAANFTRARASLPARIVAFLSSYGLATAVLSLLLLLTFLGTLEQAEYGLVASQERYFESVFVDRIDIGACWRALSLDQYWNIGNVVLPVNILPGGYTLLAILFVNMLLGGFIRIRKSPRTIGVVISHFAILFMIAAGAVTYHFAKEGILNLGEGEISDEFKSFHERVIEIEEVKSEGEKRTALVIDERLFNDLGNASDHGKARTFTHASLPFDLVVTNWKPHAEPKRATSPTQGDAVDGYYIQALARVDARSQQVLADEALSQACIAIVKDKKTGAEIQRGILWEFSAAPWTATVEGKKFAINLARRSYPLPFAIRLDATEQEKHPGTERARRFTSKVTKLQGSREEKKVITMNEPVRSEGYAIFQSNFDDGSGGGGKRSGFQVVENPSDHWPLISCLIVSFGLLLHFLLMLARAMKWNPWVAVTTPIVIISAAFVVAYWKL